MYEKIKERINSFGEVVDAELITIRKVTPEEFCQVYLNDNEEFSKLNVAEYRVLSQCWRYSNYYGDKQDNFPGNVFYYNAYSKDLIIANTGLKEGTVRNALSSLTKKEMLLRCKARGVYILNPKYFFKGQLSDRLKVIKHLIEYRFNDYEGD